MPKQYRKLHWSLYTFLEYVTFAAIFWYSITNKVFKKLIVILSIAFVFFQVSYYFTVTVRNLDSVAVGIETILIFVYAFYFLYQEFRKPDNQLIIGNPIFWVVAGMVFYLAGSFFFNILANNFSNEEWDQYWYYNYLFDDIKNILFCVAIFLFAKVPRQNRLRKDEPYLDVDHPLVNK